MASQFATRHALDSRFWAFIWIYVLIVVVIAFAPPVQDRFFDDVQEPSSIALQVHVWSFGAWMVLLATQAWLASQRRLDQHRLLGRVLLPIAAVMVASAGLSELQFHQRVLQGGGDFTGFLAVSATYLFAFSVFAIFAWMKRHNPAAHKRLILIATATLCGGAHLRIFDIVFPGVFWESSAYLMHLVVGFGGSLAIVAMGMAYDLYSRGRLHPVYRTSAPALVGLYAVAAWAYTNESFAVMARKVVESL